MDMISQIRDAFVQPAKQPLTLRENQIIQGKITKIYPNNKAEIQIGNHKLVAEILTPLSVGKQYFFQVQAADHIQLKVLGEQSGQHTAAKIDLEGLLRQLGLKTTKLNSDFMRQLVQERIPFNQDQLKQALPLIAKSSNKGEAMEMLKSMINQKLPVTASVYQALQMYKQESMSDLLNQTYTQLAQLKNPSDAEKALMRNIEVLLSRSIPNQHPAVVQQIMTNMSESSSFLNAVKALGLVDISVSENRWALAAAPMIEANEWAKQQPQMTRLQLPAEIRVPINPEQAEQLAKVLEALTYNNEAIQQTANRLKAIFVGASTASLSSEQMTQAQQMIEKELIPHLPRETAQLIQSVLQQAISAKQSPPSQQQIPQQATVAQQALYQLLDLFSKGSTFRELANIVATEVPEARQTSPQQPLPEQFLNHVRHYMQSIGMNDEYELRMNMHNPEQLAAMKNENTSVKSQLIGLAQQLEHGLGDRAQALLHFINGMQMQTVTEVNNVLQASFLLPGDKLALNQDMFMQFESMKDENGKIDSDYCQILFVLDLANIKETMIDMHIQKRIISVNIYNEQEQPAVFSILRPKLKDVLEKIDYQLSAVTWKPLYEQTVSDEVAAAKKESSQHQGKEGYDFLI